MIWNDNRTSIRHGRCWPRPARRFVSPSDTVVYILFIYLFIYLLNSAPVQSYKLNIQDSHIVESTTIARTKRLFLCILCTLSLSVYMGQVAWNKLCDVMWWWLMKLSYMLIQSCATYLTLEIIGHKQLNMRTYKHFRQELTLQRLKIY